MYHVMFDVDDTLIQSSQFDENCFVEAVKSVTGLDLYQSWSDYPHATDRGILRTFIEIQAPDEELADLERRVKAIFIQNIRERLRRRPALEVSGAKAFFHRLLADERFIVSLATGGWRETARMKLISAGFNIDDVSMASSDDHYSRARIMELARERAGDTDLQLTYFGDAVWDVRACQELGVNLVIVGNKVSHCQSIHDYHSDAQALYYITNQ
ncbi:HAD family hydrolase [Photobacterium halotolerans]|uniref:HAD hydrolase-like protein n=1 Tax=Photobacterium halotolerans TaxID=265726 RepID=A0A7X5B2A6_9GAMM|nr:HAD family hydrolase [Photobacterium halotolerans]NAW65803.1 HAD hydrolase-like protein [Photobacterium halotolerans]NAW87831.1 HAD hydrolase-like protein [Photobacterium halotolerans]NAX46016.1 HAD hydrolase-like protein [Photobacterium halotolerans]